VIFRFICTIILHYLLWLGLNQPVCAQQNLSKNFFIAKKEIWFDSIVGVENSGIINGSEYFMPLPGSDTHPFFESRNLTFERLVFNGQLYGNVPLMYDLYNDILVLRYQDKNGSFVLIQLEESGVYSFTLYGHLFKKISSIDSGGKLQSQIFDILFEGNTIDLLAKRKKTRSVVGARPEYTYDENFYFLKNNQLIRIAYKKNVSLAVNKGGKSVQDFIKRNKLNVREENDLVMIATYCDSLNLVRNK
jgi:hypothetical protein